MRSLSMTAATACFFTALLAAGPGLAEVYTWKDEKGVVHMSDRKVEKPGTAVTEMTGLQAPPATGGRQAMVQAMLAAARNNPGYAELQKIVAEYRRTHSYSTLDYFVCIDMSLEMSNILKTRNFVPKVVAGNPKVDTAGMSFDKARQTYNHAWVVVELQPGVHVALETTGGFVVDEKVQNFDLYYQGLVFKDPRQAKETDALIHRINADCQKAGEMARDFDASYAGGPATQRALEAKGMVEAKVRECTASAQQYEALIKNQYRKLY
ncbi:MAG: DUF4124 domain-containing protein [Acidobacteriota bacterium]